MKTLKRLFVALVASAMVVTTAGTAMAATQSPSAPLGANKVTVESTKYTETASTKKQTLSVKATTQVPAKVTYTSSTKKVTVDKNGKVTISKNWAGTAKITIKVAATETTKATTKTVTIKVNKKAMKKPATVTNYGSKAVSSTKINLSWGKVSKNCTGYQIKVYADAAHKKLVKTVNVKSNNTTSKTITGLKANTQYYFAVRTVNKAANSSRTTSYGKWNTKMYRATK